MSLVYTVLCVYALCVLCVCTSDNAPSCILRMVKIQKVKNIPIMCAEFQLDESIAVKNPLQIVNPSVNLTYVLDENEFTVVLSNGVCEESGEMFTGFNARKVNMVLCGPLPDESHMKARTRFWGVIPGRDLRMVDNQRRETGCNVSSHVRQYGKIVRRRVSIADACQSCPSQRCKQTCASIFQDQGSFFRCEDSDIRVDSNYITLTSNVALYEPSKKALCLKIQHETLDAKTGTLVHLKFVEMVDPLVILLTMTQKDNVNNSIEYELEPRKEDQVPCYNYGDIKILYGRDFYVCGSMQNIEVDNFRIILRGVKGMPRIRFEALLSDGIIANGITRLMMPTVPLIPDVLRWTHSDVCFGKCEKSTQHCQPSCRTWIEGDRDDDNCEAKQGAQFDTVDANTITSDDPPMCRMTVTGLYHIVHYNLVCAALSYEGEAIHSDGLNKSFSLSYNVGDQEVDTYEITLSDQHCSASSAINSNDTDTISSVYICGSLRNQTHSQSKLFYSTMQRNMTIGSIECNVDFSDILDRRIFPKSLATQNVCDTIECDDCKPSCMSLAIGDGALYNCKDDRTHHNLLTNQVDFVVDRPVIVEDKKALCLIVNTKIGKDLERVTLLSADLDNLSLVCNKDLTRDIPMIRTARISDADNPCISTQNVSLLDGRFALCGFFSEGDYNIQCYRHYLKAIEKAVKITYNAKTIEGDWVNNASVLEVPWQVTTYNVRGIIQTFDNACTENCGYQCRPSCRAWLWNSSDTYCHEVHSVATQETTTVKIDTYQHVGKYNVPTQVTTQTVRPITVASIRVTSKGSTVKQLSFSVLFLSILLVVFVQ